MILRIQRLPKLLRVPKRPSLLCPNLRLFWAQGLVSREAYRAGRRVSVKSRQSRTQSTMGTISYLKSLSSLGLSNRVDRILDFLW